MSIHPMTVMVTSSHPLHHRPRMLKRGSSGCLRRAALDASSMPRRRHDEGFVESLIGYVQRCLARVQDAQDHTRAPQLVDHACFVRTVSANRLRAGRS
eukprot:4378239-Prymnesium_polylepis.1